MLGKANGWDYSKVVTKKEILQTLSEHFELESVDPAYVGEVAKRYRYKGQIQKLVLLRLCRNRFVQIVQE